MQKKPNPFLAGLLLVPVPGLGQIYAGKRARGAAVLSITMIVWNLNAIWLSVYAAAKPAAGVFWTHSLPRILHDLFAFYGVIFLIWQIVDA